MRSAVRRAVLTAGAVVIMSGAAAGVAAAGARPPSLAFSPSPSNFRHLTVGQTETQTYTLTNTGGSASAALTVTVPGSAAFTITADTCTGTSLGPGKSCTVTVQFAPTVPGLAAATLTATSPKPATAAATDALTGTGLPVLPAAPTDLTASPGDGQVTLSWSPPAGSTVTSYNVYQGSSPGGETGTPVASTTGTSATVPGLTNGTTYYFQVAAVNAAGQGPLSNEASATPTPTVSATVTGGTMTEIQIIDFTSGSYQLCDFASSCSLSVSSGDSVRVLLMSGDPEYSMPGSEFNYTCPGSGSHPAGGTIYYTAICGPVSVTSDYSVTASFTS